LIAEAQRMRKEKSDGRWLSMGPLSEEQGRLWPAREGLPFLVTISGSWKALFMRMG
jgi:hypothetical protein